VAQGESEEAPALDVEDPGVAGAEVVRAAGGIVVRGDGDAAEVLLVHRPRGDWSFPKGKAEPGETDEETAVREVEEETGWRCDLGEFAGQTEYVDARGRPKVARYWIMTPRSVVAEFDPNDEIDALCWCTRGEAGRLLSYEPDRRLLAGLPRDVL
jgi:8-oxo-dGTP diphosphatase